MLSSLRGCAGWSAPLLLANREDRFSHVETHIPSVKASGSTHKVGMSMKAEATI